ncbi:MAG TPA: N-acetylmuramoyl-L-alanine amidase-like domain-containing protein [Blastocatellia bacterium]|nr:N-acetylmuramoyl-L-alanine amidase-like domain-containing protein [Blastocatellia bacterium]
MTGHALTTKDPPLDYSEIEAILASAEKSDGLSARIDLISGALLARPYAANPLRGGPGRPETLTASLEAFDCVTYIETVLALALSGNAAEFLDLLRRIRYEGGEVAWQKRNHYMTGWAENNESAGFVRNITDGPLAEMVTRTLSVVGGLPARQVAFNLIRKRKLASISAQTETGDLILFASAKKNLDFFHTGFLIQGEGEPRLRHATRSAGAVVEQPLPDFLHCFRMSGFVLLRPVAPADPHPYSYDEGKQD